MHFVGNRAIILGDGEVEIQLYYSSTYTAVSAVLPVVVIFLGLLIADKFYNRKRALVRYSALVVCGVCAGAAVTEMHYLGNNGTTNYRLILSGPHVFGAAGIAVGACLISFGLFFHWSGHWVNFIWRRIVVACFLALAVSGMHWTAAAGTWYELRGYHEGSGAQERNINLIIALCLVRVLPGGYNVANTSCSVFLRVLYASSLASSSNVSKGCSRTARSRSCSLLLHLMQRADYWSAKVA
jgi:NO-binding membrane sensor protein with MHYT domain